jgi:hypothetical protein
MTSHYDIKTERWIVSEGNITVKGPSRQGCIERLREMAAALQIRLFEDSPATEY